MEILIEIISGEVQHVSWSLFPCLSFYFFLTSKNNLFVGVGKIGYRIHFILEEGRNAAKNLFSPQQDIQSSGNERRFPGEEKEKHN